MRTDQGRFCDGSEVSAANLLDYVGNREGSARSEAPSVEEYETFFAERLREAEQVIHISAGDGGHQQQLWRGDVRADLCAFRENDRKREKVAQLPAFC